MLKPTLLKLSLAALLSAALVYWDPCISIRAYLVGGGEAMTYPCGMLSSIAEHIFYRGGSFGLLFYNILLYTLIAYCVSSVVVTLIGKGGVFLSRTRGD